MVSSYCVEEMEPREESAGHGGRPKGSISIGRSVVREGVPERV